MLSDRFGRKPMMLIPGALLLVLILPAFYAISHHRTIGMLLAATAVLASLLGLSSVPMVVWITESLPAAIRSGSVAVIYAVSISAFGGTTQYAVTLAHEGDREVPWPARLVLGRGIGRSGSPPSAPRANRPRARSPSRAKSDTRFA